MPSGDADNRGGGHYPKERVESREGNYASAILEIIVKNERKAGMGENSVIPDWLTESEMGKGEGRSKASPYPPRRAQHGLSSNNDRVSPGGDHLPAPETVAAAQKVDDVDDDSNEHNREHAVNPEGSIRRLNEERVGAEVRNYDEANELDRQRRDWRWQEAERKHFEILGNTEGNLPIFR